MDMIDMRPFVKAVEETLMNYIGTKERPAIGICYQFPSDGICHWATNVKREDGIILFLNTGLRMKDES